MFSNYIASCGSSAIHDEHWQFQGFFNKATCLGVRRHRCNPHCVHPEAGLYAAKTVNQIRAEAGLPEYKHKHLYEIRGATKDEVVFYCRDCMATALVGKHGLYELLTGATLIKLEQTWPQ